MLRTDRVGIWRSVPLRRGLAVLAVMPGLVAIAGNLQWEMLTILPGLVASGGALLFGVNSWCLDGRGALWRDSLPASPRLVFVSRAMVLVEVLLVASVVTVLLAALRAGLPTWPEFVAVACAAVVVVLQVTSASLRWSVNRPFAVDLRSARATPAPPLVMVGYSSRLALSTTMVGILFSVLARLSWEWAVLMALPFVLFSLYRLARTVDAWADPETRVPGGRDRRQLTGVSRPQAAADAAHDLLLQVAGQRARGVLALEAGGDDVLDGVLVERLGDARGLLVGHLVHGGAHLLVEQLLDVDAAHDGVGQRVGVLGGEVVGLGVLDDLAVGVEELVLLQLLHAEVVDHPVGDAAGLLVGQLGAGEVGVVRAGWP